MNAAMVLIAEHRLDEAEQMVLEGMALPIVTPSGSTGFAPLLKQIQALRQAH